MMKGFYLGWLSCFVEPFLPFEFFRFPSQQAEKLACKLPELALSWDRACKFAHVGVYLNRETLNPERGFCLLFPTRVSLGGLPI